jgi:hypothetical protein
MFCIDPTIIDSRHARNICFRLKAAWRAIKLAKLGGFEHQVKWATINAAQLYRQYKRLPRRRQKLVAKAA